MPQPLMQLKVLLPFQVFTDQPNVSRIVAETTCGAFGLLPMRLDCVAVLVPGILVYQTIDADETYIAVNDGVLVKTGREVVVSVRNAIAGRDLAELRSSIETEFLNLDEHERQLRSVMAKLETGFLRRFAVLQHD